MHPNVAAVVAAAERAGVAVAISSFPEGTRTAEDAARAIGCDVGQIVKSLVFLVDGQAVLALISGRNQLAEDRLAAAVGGTEVRKANADEVRFATGFPIGGVPPLAHGLKVFVDERLLGYEQVWAAAGTPRHVFGIDPGALMRAAAGTPANLAR